jgi:hypothetical protein
MNICFNYEKVGTPIAKVIGGKLNNQILHLYSPLPNEEPQDIINPLKQVKLNDGLFQIILNPHSERMVGYLTGRSGSGKSYQTGKFLEQYKKSRKNNKIYLFSPVEDDEALDKYITKRITLDKSLYEEPFALEDFQDTAVIFDDTDTIRDKKIRDAVYGLLNGLLERGRHFNTTVLITNHLASDRNTTRRILNETHWFCFFPNSGISRNLRYTLTEHVGIDQHNIEKIRQTGSRHAIIYKNYPLFCITEKDAFLLDSFA